MSGIIRLPVIRIVRERDADGWLAIVSEHGWPFGSLAEARAKRTGSPAILVYPYELEHSS
jgi:hypothetical protein